MGKRAIRVLLALLASAAGARAQDLRQVTSPDGRVQFRIFLAQPQPAALFRLAYQVLYDGKPVLDTSFLGLEILNQPILGENVGLTSSTITKGDAYKGLLAQYMQNGSLGRRINLEVRVYDLGIAFRYVVPESGPLRPMLIVDESTEFHLARDARLFEKRKPVLLSRVDSEALLPLPVTAELPGVAWVRIGEGPHAGYAHVDLQRSQGNILITTLTQKPGDPRLAVEGTTPMTCPWRIVWVGPSRKAVSTSLPALP